MPQCAGRDPMGSEKWHDMRFFTRPGGGLEGARLADAKTGQRDADDDMKARKANLNQVGAGRLRAAGGFPWVVGPLSGGPCRCWDPLLGLLVSLRRMSQLRVFRRESWL
jgi:hypothetical protein